MADLSFSIDVSDLDSKIATISAKVSDASSAVAARSAIWDKASAASSRIAASSAGWDAGAAAGEMARDEAQPTQDHRTRLARVLPARSGGGGGWAGGDR